MRSATTVCVFMACGILSSCADFNTISRRTSLPSSPAKNGVAIHLDVQQRLVIYGPDGRYCAEPSPDAMAAYAAALALGASVPSQGAGSLAQAAQSSAASIGLRTQSITLMRDALYRLCEATANNTVSPLSATMLLARNQDLTAVVVAVEQLTGAVAANQAILTSTSNADASASLIADASLLDSARKEETRKQEELTQAQAERDTQQAKVTTAQGDFDLAAAQTSAPENLPALENALNTEKNKLTTAEAKVGRAEDSLADAKRVREIIESKNSAALTQASASTSSAGQFSTVVSRKELSKEATEHLAAAVEGMVKEVLKKDYTVDACMNLLTNVTAFKTLDPAQEKGLSLTLDQCTKLLTTKIQSEVGKLHVSTFGRDPNSDRLDAALEVDPNLLPRLQRWVRNNFPEGSVTQLIDGMEHAQLRQKAISELNVP